MLAWLACVPTGPGESATAAVTTSTGVVEASTSGPASSGATTGPGGSTDAGTSGGLPSTSEGASSTSGGTTGGGTMGDCVDCDGGCELRTAVEPNANPAWALLCGTGLDDSDPVVAATAGGSLTFAFRFGGAEVGPIALTLGETFAHEGGGDAIVARLSSTGALQWSQAWGGPGSVTPRGIAATASGGAVITAQITGAVTIGGQNVGCGAECFGLLTAVLDADGGLVWHRLFPSPKHPDPFSEIFRPAVGPSDEVAVVGHFWAETDFGEGPVQPFINFQGYLVVFEADGALRFVRLIDDNPGRLLGGAAIGGDGAIVVVGFFRDLPLNLDGHKLPGKLSNFVAMFSPDDEVLWADHAWDYQRRSQAFDAAGNVYLGGCPVEKRDPQGQTQWEVGGLDHCTIGQGLRWLPDDRVVAIGSTFEDLDEPTPAKITVLDAAGNVLTQHGLDLPDLRDAAVDDSGAALLVGATALSFDILGPWTPAGGMDVWVTRVVPGA